MINLQKYTSLFWLLLLFFKGRRLEYRKRYFRCRFYNCFVLSPQFVLNCHWALKSIFCYWYFDKLVWRFINSSMIELSSHANSTLNVDLSMCDRPLIDQNMDWGSTAFSESYFVSLFPLTLFLQMQCKTLDLLWSCVLSLSAHLQ